MRFLEQKYRSFSDEKLMALITQGEAAGAKAFHALYDRYSRRLLHYFFRMLGGDEEKAQDFLQDIFLKVVERPEHFDRGARFTTWIFSVAHNMCKNEYRRLEVRKIIDRDVEVDAIVRADDTNDPHAVRDIMQAEFVDSVLRELKSFDEAKRSTFLLRYQQGFSIKEISETLGCAEGTTKSRLFYVTKLLADKLREFNPKNEEASTHGKLESKP